MLFKKKKTILLELSHKSDKLNAAMQSVFEAIIFLLK